MFTKRNSSANHEQNLHLLKNGLFFLHITPPYLKPFKLYTTLLLTRPLYKVFFFRMM